MSTFDVQQFEVGGLDANFSYLISHGKSTAVVDPSGDISSLLDAVESRELALLYVLITHAHADHISQLHPLLEKFPTARVIAHPKAHLPVPFEPAPNHLKLTLGTGTIEVIYAPGHTPDSLLFKTDDDAALFTGDTLFIDYCGFADPAILFQTFQEVVKPLPDCLMIYSGHNYGAVPSRSLGYEKQHNPYLLPETLEDFKTQYAKLT